MSVLDTTPRATQAGILRAVLAEKHPKFALGSIAHHHQMTMDQLQTILRHHGYPETARMAAAATAMESADTFGVHTADGNSVGPELGDLADIPVDQLHPDPDNPRDELRDIEDLAASMLESGLLQPVIARRHNGRLYLVAGHRRLAAAKLNRWATIPCIVRSDMRPDDVLAAMLIENGQRSDLDPIEEARGLKRLKIQLGCTDVELAKRIGRSGATVSNRLALLSLTAEEQEEIRRGGMTLIEGQHKGRLNSGKVMRGGHHKRGWHLGPEHPLATQVKARCKRLGHRAGRTVGGMGCGACWESVLRADEREHLQESLVKTGRCTVCGTEHRDNE